MDILTHGLASLAIARGFFPRAGRTAMVGAVIAGTIADVDWSSIYFGPAAFLTWRGTYTHSTLAAIVFSVIFSAIVYPISNEKGGETPEGASAKTRPVKSLALVSLAAAFFAAILHIAMDACQSSGVALFWPFSSRRFAADWLPGLDPWILTILFAAIALPELLNLVSSEIGAKSKKPRGRTGAVVGLTLVLVYIGVRGTLHSNVLTLMESRTFHGEIPRRASAFPESLSLLTWHGVVETESALNQMEVNVASSTSFDPDVSLRLFKPQASPVLDAARNTAAAKRILAAAQVPKASVEKTESGYLVILRDLRYAATSETQHEVAALLALDANNKVTSQELVWARDLPR